MFKDIIQFIISYYKSGAPCLFHHVTGLYCPGCGGTRALLFLLSGHPILSFVYHPLVLYIASLSAYILLRHIIDFALRPKDVKKGFYLQSWMTWGMLFIVIVNFVVKNVALVCFHTDLLNLL